MVTCLGGLKGFSVGYAAADIIDDFRSVVPAAEFQVLYY